MLMRSWLSGLMQAEADGVGESPAAGAAVDSPVADYSAPTEPQAASAEAPPAEPEPGEPDHAANVAFVKEWSKTADADRVSATVTSTEPNKDFPVVETTTDAVGDADDASATSGNGQDDLLLALAEAYDFTREELKGISNEGLTSLIAREKRRQGVLETATPEATGTTTTPQQPDTAAETGDTQAVTFDRLAQAIRDDLTEQGYGEDAIERQVQMAKLKWDREESLVTDARTAREETQWVRHQFEQERRAQFEANERQGFFEIVAKVAATEKELLPQRGQANAPSNQVDNLNKWWQAFNLVKQTSREVQELSRTNLSAARAKAAHIAFTITFPEVVAKRGQKAYSAKVLKQAANVMGTPRSARAPETGSSNGNPWDSPAIVRQWNKMQANKS